MGLGNSVMFDGQLVRNANEYATLVAVKGWQ